MTFADVLADPQLYESIWSTSSYPLHPKTTGEIDVVMTWTLWFFIAAFLLLIIPDIFRIYNRKYSLFSVVYKRVIRLKELYAVGPQIYLVLGCTVVFLFVVLGYISPMAAIAGMLIAAFGDAAAAIIGRRYGTHKFKTIFQKRLVLKCLFAMKSITSYTMIYRLRMRSIG